MEPLENTFVHILPWVGKDNLKEGLHSFKTLVADTRHKSSWTVWQFGRSMVNHGQDLWAVELLVHTVEEITSFHLGSGNAAQAPAGSLTPLSRKAQWGVVGSLVCTRGATEAVELRVRTLGLTLKLLRKFLQK